jgi:predicted nucleic acid-binding protein
MYIFDTNAAYYLTDRTFTTTEQLARLHELAEANQLQIGLPPVTVLELASRIGEQPDWFPRVKETAAALMTLKPTPLPDPEQRMREITENIELARQSYQHWLQLLDTIARAPDLDRLNAGFDDYATATHRSGNVIYVAKYRASYEEQYVRDMLQLVKQINPRYDAQLLREETTGKQVVTSLPKNEQDSLRAFFGSPEWTAMFVATLASRGGSGVMPTEQGTLSVVLKKAAYYQRAYESLCIDTFCAGRRPSLKRKNDYNDIHQLLYVNEFANGDKIVSEDDGPCRRAGQADGKVITYREFLATVVP